MILSPLVRNKYFNTNGAPLAGGKLYTYAATTTTPQATYTDSGGLTPNANPVVLDANGEANVWMDASLSYKFVLKDSSDVTQWTVDNVSSVIGTSQIADGAVTAPKIGAAAVTGAKLNSTAADGSSLEVAGGSMRIKDLGVVTAKINDLGVTTPKIADLGVTTAKINDLGVTTAKLNDLAVTLAKMIVRTVTTDGSNPGAGGVSISASSGTFSTTNTSASAVTNLSCILTTTGKRVIVKLVSDGSGNDSYIGANASGAFSECLAHFQLKQGSTIIYTAKIDAAIAASTGIGVLIPSSIVNHEYAPVAGTYTYTAEIWQTGSSSATCYYSKLMVYETF